MKTLIFDGSPHPKGDTATLIQAMTENLSGEYQIIRAYDERNVSPCMDCRYCWQHPVCAMQDGMTRIYRMIQESDAIVIASPLYYSELTGPLLAMFSRLQLFYCANRFQGIRLNEKEKKGGILLTGGGMGGPSNAIKTAKILLRAMGAKDIAEEVMSLRTDSLPARQDSEALQAARVLGQILSKK
ncbi:MAG: flavodoxin family protein [Clostridiales bacterium]|nr:flavodoxin family protein [Clostridiales bacterium]